LAGCQAVWPLKRDFETVPSDGFSFIFMDIKNNFEGYYLRIIYLKSYLEILFS